MSPFYAGWGGTLPDTGSITYGLYLANVSDSDKGVISLPPATEWTRARSVSLSGWKVKGVRIWFPPGTRQLVEIQIHYNKSPWLPDPGFRDFSDHYSGDDTYYWIPVNRVISNNDIVDIFYRNLDITNRIVDVKFQMIGEREWKMKTPEDIQVEKGIGNMEKVHDVLVDRGKDISGRRGV